MYHIGICDKDEIYCNYLECMLESIALYFGDNIQIEIFYSGETLFKALNTDNKKFDWILLEVESSCMNGIDVGRHIRQKLNDQITKLIYLYSDEKHTLKLFKSRPFDFLMKPVLMQNLEGVYSAVKKVVEEDKIYFQYKKSARITRVMQSEILYFESNGRKIIIYSVNGSDEFYGKLSDVVSSLKENKAFIRIHSSYFVNYHHIIDVQYGCLKMCNGCFLPISHSKRAEVRQLIKQKR